MKVYMIFDGEDDLVFTSPLELAEHVVEKAKELDVHEKVELIIKRDEMSKEEIESLPETD
jgi:hypothetical protein